MWQSTNAGIKMRPWASSTHVSSVEGRGARLGSGFDALDHVALDPDVVMVQRREFAQRHSATGQGAVGQGQDACAGDQELGHIQLGERGTSVP